MILGLETGSVSQGHRVLVREEFLWLRRSSLLLLHHAHHVMTVGQGSCLVLHLASAVNINWLLSSVVDSDTLRGRAEWSEGFCGPSLPGGNPEASAQKGTDRTGSSASASISRSRLGCEGRQRPASPEVQYVGNTWTFVQPQTTGPQPPCLTQRAWGGA